MVKIPKGRLAEARLAGGWADLQRGSAAGAKKNQWIWGEDFDEKIGEDDRFTSL